MPTRDRITAILGFQKYRVIDFKRIRKKWIYLWLEGVEERWPCPSCRGGSLGGYD